MTGLHAHTSIQKPIVSIFFYCRRNKMSSGNSDHNKGVEAWEARRKQWTTPNQHYYDTVSQLTANNEKYDFLIKQEAQRMAIYKQLVHNRQGLRTPVSLKYIVKKKIK